MMPSDGADFADGSDGADWLACAEQPVVDKPMAAKNDKSIFFIVYCFLFFSDRNGADFLAEEEENLIYFIESQCFLSLLQFSYESETYARFRGQIYLSQSELLAHFLDV